MTTGPANESEPRAKWSSFSLTESLFEDPSHRAGSRTLANAHNDGRDESAIHAR